MGQVEQGTGLGLGLGWGQVEQGTGLGYTVVASFPGLGQSYNCECMPYMADLPTSGCGCEWNFK